MIVVIGLIEDVETCNGRDDKVTGVPEIYRTVDEIEDMISAFLDDQVFDVPVSFVIQLAVDFQMFLIDLDFIISTWCGDSHISVKAHIMYFTDPDSDPEGIVS
jgi:hypothetical protein